MHKKTKAVIFARVSTKSQEDEGYSLESQLKLMRSYCKTKGLNVDKEVTIAETASKDLRRKSFHQLVGYITSKRINNLVVEKTDRLTRNFKDATIIDDWLEKDDRRMLHMVKENLILHKNARSDAKFMWNIYLSVAKKYSDNLREEAMKGWAEKLAQGWLPAEPPPGYKTSIFNGKKIHVVDEEAYKYVQHIFKLASLPGYTRSKLSEEMFSLGLKTKNGRPFNNSAVTRILTNPFYIGINVLQAKEYKGAQEPIITKTLFKQVQQRIKGGHTSRLRSKHNPVFKGMITCEKCGYIITWSKQKNRFYGACSKRKLDPWAFKYLREDRVETLVISKLEALHDPKDKLFNKLKSLMQIIDSKDIGMFRQKMISELTSNIQRLGRMEDALYEDKLSRLITAERYSQKYLELAKQKTDFVNRLTLLNLAQDSTKHAKEEIKSEDPIVNLYLNSSPTQKRIILSTVFKKLKVGAEVIIEYL
jgi:site-specific DNA recombinase